MCLQAAMLSSYYCLRAMQSDPTLEMLLSAAAPDYKLCL